MFVAGYSSNTGLCSDSNSSGRLPVLIELRECINGPSELEVEEALSMSGDGRL